eukprot:TRINITY_DN1819_c0_g1_i3.p1 TRINITY_DN1819_c0_g1~~TRINITY_DN1819_c0_g1_i3.p1  ORF type:complete len:270 (+),score=29.60 TRINITY_DN1819_c0_g1_i3:218-1027(+)
MQSPLEHNHLVRCYGAALPLSESRDNFFVFEFMVGGSIDRLLFPRTAGASRVPLAVDPRLKVSLGVAKGLTFLHSRNLCHGAVQASKVLLDENYNAKLACFGATTDLSADNESQQSSDGRLSKQSDVIAFGVLLLELISGRPSSSGSPLSSLSPPESPPRGLPGTSPPFGSQTHFPISDRSDTSLSSRPPVLSSWVRSLPLMSNDIPPLEKFADKRLHQEYERDLSAKSACKQAYCVARICIRERPEMETVVGKLQIILKLRQKRLEQL